MRLRVIAPTVLKHQPKQSSELADHEKLVARAGDEFAVDSSEEAEGQHLKVVLAAPIDGSRLVWYVFRPHVELLEEGGGAPANPDFVAPSATPEPAPTDDPASAEAPAGASPASTNPLAVSEAEANMTTTIGCGGAMALLGVLLLVVPVGQFVNLGDTFPGRLNAWGWGAAGVGIVSAGFGAWMGIDSLIAGRKAKRDRIQATFFHLLDANSGEITLLQFARAASLSGADAQKYLDSKAKEFNATFDVNTDGGIYYRFK